MNDSLENLWRRAKREAEIKVANIGSEGPFPDNYGTADEVLTDDLPQVLEIAAEEMDSAPLPRRRYRTGEKLEELSDQAILNHRGKRIVTGFTGGAGIGSLAAHDMGPEGSIYVMGGMVTGIAVFGAGEWAVSGVLGKAGEKMKSGRDDLQATTNSSYGSPGIIKNKLSGREDNYAVKAFREDGLESAERLSKSDVEEFLDDLREEAETEWRVKRKEDYPLQVIGISAEYNDFKDRSYELRKEIAYEIAEEENIPVEEVLDVNEDIESNLSPAPVESRHEESSVTYDFLIVDINPSYSFDIENNFMDYSSILGIEEDEYDQERVAENV